MRKPVEVTYEGRCAAAVMTGNVYTHVHPCSTMHAVLGVWDRTQLRAVGSVVLYVHRNRRLIRPDGNPGWPLRLPHSSWALTGHRCARICIIIRSVCVVGGGGGGGGGAGGRRDGRPIVRMLIAVFTWWLHVDMEKAEDELCERLGLPVPKKGSPSLPHGLCGRKTTLNERLFWLLCCLTSTEAG